VSVALRRRDAAIRAVRGGWIGFAARRCAAAAAALDRGHGGVDGDHHDDLRDSLTLEAALLAAMWRGRLEAAGAAYQALVEHHGTGRASRAAYAGVLADVPAFGLGSEGDQVNPLAFAVPFSVIPSQRKLLLTVLPPLRRCSHGRWYADGVCRCPDASPPH
jgi:hypothetical protein